MPVLLRMERNGVLVDGAKLDAQSHELGKEMLEHRAEGLPGGGPALQPRARPSRSSEILFEQAEAAGEEEDAQGPALDRRGRARRTRARLSAAEAAARVPRPREAQVHLHRQAAAHGRSRTPGACTPPTRRPPRSPGASPRTIPTCRTSRSARRRAGASARPSSRRRAARSSPPTTRRSSCASWRTSRATRACATPSTHGHDVHQATAAEVFGVPLEKVSKDERRTAKVINFGLIYGMSAFGLAQNLGIERATAQAYIESYFNRYPGREEIHGRDAGESARARATSRPCSAGACACPRSSPARPRAARAPSAPPSTRRCRAPPPT